MDILTCLLLSGPLGNIIHTITTIIIVVITIIIIVLFFIVIVIVIYPANNYLLIRSTSTQTSASIAFDEPSQLSLQSCIRGFFDCLPAASHVAHLNKRHK